MKLHSPITNSGSSKITPITNHAFSLQNAGVNSNMDAPESKEGKSQLVDNSINLGKTTEKSKFFATPHKIHGFTCPTNNKKTNIDH